MRIEVSVLSIAGSSLPHLSSISLRLNQSVSAICGLILLDRVDVSVFQFPRLSHILVFALPTIRSRHGTIHSQQNFIIVIICYNLYLHKNSFAWTEAADVRLTIKKSILKIQQ